jgi:hypothetical protein
VRGPQTKFKSIYTGNWAGTWQLSSFIRFGRPLKAPPPRASAKKKPGRERKRKRSEEAFLSAKVEKDGTGRRSHFQTARITLFSDRRRKWWNDKTPSRHSYSRRGRNRKVMGEEQSVYLSGRMIAEKVTRENAIKKIALAPDKLRLGKNVVAIVATPEPRERGKRRSEGAVNQDNHGLVCLVTPPGLWSRSLLNSVAQIIVQSIRQLGEIKLTAKSSGLSGVLNIPAMPATLRAAIR